MSRIDEKDAKFLFNVVLKVRKQLLFHGKHFAIRHYLISVLLK